MNRQTKSDFDLFKRFFYNYNLDKLKDQEYLWDLYKQSHKYLYAIMIFMAELDLLNEQVEIDKTKFRIGNEFFQEEFPYLKECCSDLASALFISVHGVYKGTRILMRSSIEMFLRGMFSMEFHNIKNEKNLYKIFRIICESEFINRKEIIKEHFFNIHDIYKQLCQYSHTASFIHMDHITSLDLFPKYDHRLLKGVAKEYNTLIQNYLFLLVIRFKKYFIVYIFLINRRLLTAYSKKIDHL